MGYRDVNNDFRKKYDKEIRGIARENGVDMGVATDMLKANVRNSRSGSDTIYGGGGSSTDWGGLEKDYDNVVRSARENNNNSSTSSGATINQVAPTGAVPQANSAISDLQAYISQLIASQNKTQESWTNQMNDLKAQQEANQQKYETERQGQKDYMNWALNPDTYQTILGQVMEQYNPLLEQQKGEITEQYGEMSRQADVDAERRGLYNSGVASEMQNKVQESKADSIADALASLRAQAVQGADTYQNKMMQKAIAEGNWTSQDRQLDAQDIQSYADTYLKGQTVNNNMASNIGELLGRDASLGLQNQGQWMDYTLGQQRLGLDSTQLLENARQFNAGMDFRYTDLAQDMDKFAKQMGYNWANMRSNEKTSLANANLRAMELKLAQGKFESQQQQIEAERTKEKMADSVGAYSMLSSLLSQEGVDAGTISSMIEPYKNIYPDLYADLSTTAFNELRARQTPGGRSVSSGNTTQSQYKPFGGAR